MRIINNRKNIIICIICMLIVLIGFLTYNLFNNRSKVSKDGIFNNVDNSSMFAFYLEQEDGTYKKTSENEWPSGYKINKNKSGCIDTTGNTLNNTLSYDVTNKMVRVKTSKATYCYIYFDKIVPDIKIDVSTDGNNGMVPSTGIYQKNVVCTNGSASYNDKYQRLEISGITNNNIHCTLEYKKSASSNTLVSQIENSAENITYYQISENPTWDTFSKEDYGTPSIYYAYYSSVIESTSGTSADNIFEYKNGIWYNTPSNMTPSNNNSYYFVIEAPENAGYQFCYSMDPGNSNNHLYVFTKANKNYYSAQTNTKTEGCVEIGYLFKGDKIKILNNSPTMWTTVQSSFYLQKTNNIDLKSSGYRYIGKNPNNYVWFNNEMWRIIGSIPTCTSVDCKSKENLVKIIREDHLGVYAYDASSYSYSGYWGENTLYSLLNNYYYGQLDGTSSGYCFGNYNNDYPQPNCDFIVKGIAKDDKYGKMIKKIYWNTGSADYNDVAGDIYSDELQIQTVEGYVGLINLSDYAFAASRDYHYTSMINYNEAIRYNWIFNYAGITTGTAYKTTERRYKIFLGSNGVPSNTYAFAGSLVHPVVYLDSNVKIISGSGTLEKPYIIGI